MLSQTAIEFFSWSSYLFARTTQIFSTFSIHKFRKFWSFLPFRFLLRCIQLWYRLKLLLLKHINNTFILKLCRYFLSRFLNEVIKVLRLYFLVKICTQSFFFQLYRILLSLLKCLLVKGKVLIQRYLLRLHKLFVFWD